MKKVLLIILISFFAYGVFSSPDILNSDRDNAVIISARALMSFENPYNYTTEINQKITTGLFNAFISIPFVYLFGNIQVLSFLFYFIFLICIYNSRHFYKWSLLIALASPFIWRVMYYRLDELYWVLFYVSGIFYFKSKWRLLLLIPILFSRNIFNFNFQVLLYNLDYWLIILAVYTAILFFTFRKLGTRLID